MIGILCAIFYQIDVSFEKMTFNFMLFYIIAVILLKTLKKCNAETSLNTAFKDSNFVKNFIENWVCSSD